MNKYLFAFGFSIVISVFGLSFILNLADSSVKGESDIYNLVFEALEDMPQNNELTGQVINDGKRMINQYNMFMILIGLIGFLIMVISFFV